MSRITRICLLAVVAALLLVSPASEAQTVKIGVFDAQTVSENSAIGKRIQAELTAFTEAKESEISLMQQRLGELRDQLSKQALSLSPDKRASLQKDIQRHELELRSFQESASRELELEYNSATRDFQDKLIVAIETFGRDEGFSLILDRSQIAWADAAIDVTAALVDRFNKMFPVAETGN